MLTISDQVVSSRWTSSLDCDDDVSVDKDNHDTNDNNDDTNGYGHMKDVDDNGDDYNGECDDYDSNDGYGDMFGYTVMTMA